MVRLRDVTLRDGLQDERPVETDDKIALLLQLLAAGVRDLELTSFTRPDRVPAMADADRFCSLILGMDLPAVLWALVLNFRGAQRAIAAGMTHLVFVVSVSEAHNMENVGRSVSESMIQLGQIVDLAADTGSVVEVTLATAFGCPYTGPVEPRVVMDVAQQAVDLGLTRLTLADTIGTAIPGEVASLVTAISDLAGPEELGVHLHDTRGLAIANALAAVEAGADRLDGTAGGLGGCPFAPGASGNLPLEDLVHVLDAMGVDTGINLTALLAASKSACEAVGRPSTSHIGAAGPRFQKRATRHTTRRGPRQELT
jgi:hydroxymethylglutaryl-CoA lyase